MFRAVRAAWVYGLGDMIKDYNEAYGHKVWPLLYQCYDRFMKEQVPRILRRETLKMNAAIAHLTMATLREDGTTKIGAPAELMIGRLGPRHVVGKHSMSQTQPAEEALSPLAHERIAHKV